jgi:hypothetical protein
MRSFDIKIRFDFLFSAPLVAEIVSTPKIFRKGKRLRRAPHPCQKIFQGVLFFCNKRGAENKKAYLTGVQILKPSSIPPISSLS